MLHGTLEPAALWWMPGKHATPSTGFLLELASNRAIFLPSLEKTTVSGGKPQESKDDKSVWLLLSPWFLVNQQRDQMLSKGQEGEHGHYARVSKQK